MIKLCRSFVDNYLAFFNCRSIYSRLLNKKSSWNNIMSCCIFLEIRPLPLPKLDLFRPSDTFSKGEGKRKTVFERVIVLRVEEVFNKKNRPLFISNYFYVVIQISRILLCFINILFKKLLSLFLES